MTPEELKNAVLAASPEVQQELFRLLGELRRAGNPTHLSLHEQLKRYENAGPTGVKDLASNPMHLSGYGGE